MGSVCSTEQSEPTQTDENQTQEQPLPQKPPEDKEASKKDEKLDVAPAVEESKPKLSGIVQNEAKLKQRDAKIDDEARIFLDKPLELPPEMPGLDREKSIWVLGPNKTDASAPIKQYKFLKRLGSPGQFGEAWLCHYGPKLERRAVKKIAKARFIHHNDPKRAQKYLSSFSAEVQIMQRLDHKYIIKFHEAFEDSNFLYMAMELCTGGELFDRIVEKKKHTEKEAAKTLKMLFEGLAYMHHHGLAHCDLKPDNFLFLNKDEDSPIKIIDFGLAKPIHPHDYHNQFCGTPYYVAPEMLRPHGYNQSCDLWSMGVIMFLMIFGYPPFHSNKKKENNAGHSEIFRKIKGGFHNMVRSGYGPWFPKHIQVSAEARDLMASLMEMDTSKRITADEALNHPWFKKAEDLGDSFLDDRVLASLRDFRKQGKFKQMLLGALISNAEAESANEESGGVSVGSSDDMLNNKERKMLEDVLKGLDLNGDGYICVNELQLAFKGSLAEDDIRRIAESADIKGDEVISIEELAMVYLDRKVSAKEERLWQAFTKLDHSGNMKLSMEDVKKAIKETKGVKYTEEEIEHAFNQADLDGNGHIDYDEFLFLWGSKYAPPRRNSHAHRVMSTQSFSKTERPDPVDNATPKHSPESKKRNVTRPARKLVQD